MVLKLSKPAWKKAGLDAVMSQSVAQAKALAYAKISRRPLRWTPYKNDISSTVSKVPELLSAVDDVVHQYYPDWEVCWYDTLVTAICTSTF